MNQPLQKDLDNAATDRHDAKVLAYRERIEANKKAHAKFAGADETFVKDLATAKARAMNRDPISGSPGSGPAESVDPTAEDAYWQRAFITEPYYNRNYSYNDYGPAYRLGYMHRSAHPDRSWDEVELELITSWAQTKGASRLSKDEARSAIESAWYHAGASLL